MCTHNNNNEKKKKKEKKEFFFVIIVRWKLSFIINKVFSLISIKKSKFNRNK